MKKKSQISLSTRQDEEPKNGFEPESTGPYQTFNSTFGVLNEENPVTDPIGYSEGAISPVDNDDGDVTMTLGKESSVDFFKKLVATKQWSSIATFDFDIALDNIQKYSSNSSFGLKKDLRLSLLDKKFDLFYFNFSAIKKADLQYCIANSLAASRPLSIGFVAGIGSDNIPQLEKLGFSKSLSFSSDNCFFVKKNDMDNLSNIEIFGSDGSKKAQFLCDIASTMSDKIAGLQPYHSIKYGSGLVFKYGKPQDVTYHMGSVSFPIDIIFVGSNDKIKKIVKNILPGTLGVFGSSDISSVVEISGDASSCLGIEVGDKLVSNNATDLDTNKYDVIFSNLSSSNKCYIKNASFTRKISFGQFDIFNINNCSNKISDFIKTASSQDVPSSKDISIYNFDDFFTSGFGKIKLSNGIQREVSSVTGIMMDSDPSKTGSLSNFMSINSFTPPDIRTAFGMMRDDFSNNKRVVVATNITENLDVLKMCIVKRACEEVVFDHNIHSIEIVSIPEDLIISNNQDILARFGANSLSFNKISMKKESGAQIPDEIKEQASLALEHLSSGSESLDDILSAFNNNADQYTKNKDNKEVINGSADAYSISSKRLSKKIVDMLLQIKKSIKIMNDIKDISSVDEKIEALALSCKEFVRLVEEIFDLESKITEDDFVDNLVELTTKLEKSVEDVGNNINNFSDYILKNILNKKVLSR